ncbi:MAG: hypothetical protein WD627_07025 [Actinomycetota bacterium]
MSRESFRFRHLSTKRDRLSFSPSISADGRWVAFVSDDPNLIPGDTNGYSDVFLRDLQEETTTLISAALVGRHLV